MQKVWSYIAVGLAFFSLGILVMWKLMGEQYKIVIKKIKTKKNLGDTSVTIPIEIDGDTQSRMDKRIERQKARLDKRIKRKEARN